MTVFFIDIEASGLLPGSFPVEVAWVDEHGVGEAHLIAPEPAWHYWDFNAQQIHGLSRDHLVPHGRPAADVARRAVDVLGSAEVYSDAPGFDSGWLDILLEAADLPPDAVRLLPLDDLLKRACAPLFEGLDPDISDHTWAITAAMRRGEGLVRDAQVREERRAPRRHRALADAEGNRRVWSDVRERVAEAVARR